jgi:hypothetical protein
MALETRLINAEKHLDGLPCPSCGGGPSHIVVHWPPEDGRPATCQICGGVPCQTSPCARCGRMPNTVLLRVVHGDEPREPQVPSDGTPAPNAS